VLEGSAHGSDGIILEESPPRNTTTWIRWRPNLVDDRLSEQIRTRAWDLNFIGGYGFERDGLERIVLYCHAATPPGTTPVTRVFCGIRGCHGGIYCQDILIYR
jgi:hypothetical protein